MKKILFFLSALSVLVLFPGCMTGYRTVVVVSDYDERCWFEGHWVYRFYEGDRWLYRRWYNDRWEIETREIVFWQTQKWERTARNNRDDGRKYEHEQNNEEKKENNSGKKQDNKQENKHKGGHK